MPFLDLLAQQAPEEPLHPPQAKPAGEEHHAGHGTLINPLEPADPANIKAGFWALGIFVVLAMVLAKFAWGPIAKGMKAREDRINDSLKRAEEVEKATRELQATLEAGRAKAQLEAQAIVAEARTAAKQAAEAVAAKAMADIEAAKERHHRELSLEADRVRAELRRDAVELTIAATSKLIGRSLDAADRTRLAEEALRDAERVARN